MINSELFQNIPSQHEILFPADVAPYYALANLDDFMNKLFEDKHTPHNDCIIIGSNTVVGENAVIQAPVIIGNNCIISPHALIRPYSIICDNAVIGHAAEIKHSIIFPGAKVQSFAFAGDSIIGKSARVGSGCILANRNFDQSDICIELIDDSEKKSIVDTHIDFLGCILGDYARLGANSTTQPGTIIGAYSWVFPAMNVWGIIPSNKKVRNEKKIVLSDNEKHILKD